MSWMTTSLAKSRVPLAMIIALTVCGGGCQSDREVAKGRPGEEFLRDDETSAVTRIAERQMAAGARTEATLRAYHFDHAALNGLGREKLDFMLAGAGEQGELVVYLDLAGDDANRQHAVARRADVTEYLGERGLAEGEFRLESGHNPHNTMSVVSAVPPKDAAADEGPADAAAAMLEAVSDMMPKR